MFSKGTTWPPKVPTQTHAFSGSMTMTPKIKDRLNSGRSPAEAPATASGDARPAESHWESIIDRATD